MSRKLLFFFDGSSNRVAGPAGIVPTNMYHLNQAFTNGTPESPQISFYFSGVGTRGDRLSAVTGKGFDEIVIDAYTNLASNYVPGDEVYLFGFSRGAAAARILSAMISYPGLLIDTDLSLKFKYVWRLFTKKFRLRDQKVAEYEGLLRGSLRDPPPSVNFVGVFDTVPGSNWDREKFFIKLRIRDLNLESCVNHAVHLLAMDDNRVPSFEPLLWEKRGKDLQIIEQIWMPGVHGDIGGHSDAKFIGNIALLTMLERVRKYCPELELDEASIKRLLKDTFQTNRQIHITTERIGLFPNLLFRGRRLVGKQPGTQVHELLIALQGKKFSIRGRNKIYSSGPFDSSIPVYKTSFSQLIKEKLGRVHTSEAPQR